MLAFAGVDRSQPCCVSKIVDSSGHMAGRLYGILLVFYVWKDSRESASAELCELVFGQVSEFSSRSNDCLPESSNGGSWPTARIQHIS